MENHVLFGITKDDGFMSIHERVDILAVTSGGEERAIKMAQDFAVTTGYEHVVITKLEADDGNPLNDTLYQVEEMIADLNAEAFMQMEHRELIYIYRC